MQIAETEFLQETSISPYAAVYVILKVTERCNLACPYCYMFFAGDETFKIHPATILDDTVEGLIAFLSDAIRQHGVRNVHIGIHGGEPLLLKKSAFSLMCAKIRTALDPMCELQLSIQTNGVLIDPEWIGVFEKHNIYVGISFDGDEELHNRTRITKKGRGTYAESRRGWELVRDAHDQGRIGLPGILCVVAPGNPGGRIYRHFIDELGAKNINFLWPNFNHDSPEATAEFIAACGDFMVDVCSAWFSGKANIRVRFIREIVGPLLDDEICARLPTNRYNPFELITVSSNGEISPDDVIRSVAPKFRESALRVKQNTMRDLMTHRIWLEIDRAQKILPEKCGECVWRNICRGGMPQHRYSAKSGFDNPSIYCDSLRRVFGYVADNLIKGGVPMESIEQRLEKTFG